MERTKRGHPIIIEGVVGSTAYGMSTPESDQDYLGVWMAPISDMIGLHPPVGKAASIVEHEPDDRALHEIGKFVNLCLKANPTVMELLWLDDYVTLTPAGQKLIDYRYAFLSKRIRNTYGGYAMEQVKRLQRRNDGSFASDLRKRTEKHGRHVARLLVQGRSVFETGKLKVRLDQHEVGYCREVGVMAAEDPNEFAATVDLLFFALDHAADESSMMDDPIEEVVNDLLVDIRQGY